MRKIYRIMLLAIFCGLLVGTIIAAINVRRIQAILDNLYELRDTTHSGMTSTVINIYEARLTGQSIALSALVTVLVVFGIAVVVVNRHPRKQVSAVSLLLLCTLLVTPVSPVTAMLTGIDRWYARVEMNVPANPNIGDLVDVSGYITPMESDVSDRWICYHLGVAFPDPSLLFGAEWIAAGCVTDVGMGSFFYMEWMVDDEYFENQGSDVTFDEPYYTKVAITLAPDCLFWSGHVWDSDGNRMIPEWSVFGLPLYGQKIVAVAGGESISTENDMSALFSGLTWMTMTLRTPPRVPNNGMWDGDRFSCKVIQDDPYTVTMDDEFYKFMVSVDRSDGGDGSDGDGGSGGGGGGPGCPFVCTWNGTHYMIDNNVLGDSEASGGSDVEDYYRLEQPLVCRDGKYGLLISEFEQEHSYLDQVSLMAVDHESDVHVAVTHGGEILTYKEPNTPVSVVDNDGESWLDTLEAADGCYYMGSPGDHLLVDFGDLDLSEGAKLVLRDDIKFKDPIECVHVQILDADDGWKDIAALRTRTYWATDIVDLADHLPDANGELKVRLYFTGIHKIDYVGLDTTKQDDFDLHHANLVSATHSEEGGVKTELSESDGIYAELVPGEQIELAFTLPENAKDTRTYIVYAKGRYYTIS